MLVSRAPTCSGQARRRCARGMVLELPWLQGVRRRGHVIAQLLPSAPRTGTAGQGSGSCAPWPTPPLCPPQALPRKDQRACRYTQPARDIYQPDHVPTRGLHECQPAGPAAPAPWEPTALGGGRWVMSAAVTVPPAPPTAWRLSLSRGSPGQDSGSRKGGPATGGNHRRPGPVSGDARRRWPGSAICGAARSLPAGAHVHCGRGHSWGVDASQG